MSDIYADHALRKWQNKLKTTLYSKNTTLYIYKYSLNFTDDHLIVAQDRKDLVEFMSKRLFKDYKNWDLIVSRTNNQHLCIGAEKKDLSMEADEGIGTCNEYIWVQKYKSPLFTANKGKKRVIKKKRMIG